MKHMSNILIGMPSRWLVGAMIVISVPFAFAQQAAPAGNSATQNDSPASLVERYPAGSIQSSEAANRALSEVKQAQASIEAHYADEQHACYPKFFATSCLDEAKERRRLALLRVRPIEVEANAYLRQARVVERDQKLAEKQAQEEANAPQHEKRRLKKEAELADKPGKGAHDAAQKEAHSNVRANDAAKRNAQRQEKLEHMQAEESAEAQKRAENIAAYEKKVREAEARQRSVAERKAKKEQERANK